VHSTNRRESVVESLVPVSSHPALAGKYIITVTATSGCHHEDRNCHRDGAVARETMYTALSLLSLHAQR